MNISNITRELIFKSKTDIDSSFSQLKDRREFVCSGLSCFDLSNLSAIRDIYHLANDMRFVLVYHFHDLKNNERHHFSLAVKHHETIHSYVKFWNSLYTFEEIVRRDFGIKIYDDEKIKKNELIDDSKYLLHKDWQDSPFEEKKSHNSNVNYESEVLNFSDLSGRNRGVELEFSVDGDNLINCSVFDHLSGIGLEKKVEGTDLKYIKNIISHFGIDNFLIHQILWQETLEKIYEHDESDDYQKFKRMFFYELSRSMDIISVLIDLLNYLGNKNFSMKLNDHLRELLALLGEVRIGSPFPVLFDYSKDIALPVGWKNKVLSLINESLKCVKSIRGGVFRSHSMLDLLLKKNDKIDVLKLGLTGIPLRSCGLRHDLRKSDKFYFYHDVDLKSALGISLSFYDRIIVLLEELEHSFDLLIRLLESFPRHTSYSPKHTSHSGESIFFSFTESAFGELEYFLIVKDNKIDRLNVMNASQRSLSFWRESSKGNSMEFMILNLLSLGISLPEVFK